MGSSQSRESLNEEISQKTAEFSGDAVTAVIIRMLHANVGSKVGC